jgi:ribosomal protein L7/L12
MEKPEFKLNIKLTKEEATELNALLKTLTSTPLIERLKEETSDIKFKKMLWIKETFYNKKIEFKKYIDSCIHDGNRLQAIKDLKNLTNEGLKESKNAIDNITFNKDYSTLDYMIKNKTDQDFKKFEEKYDINFKNGYISPYLHLK